MSPPQPRVVLGLPLYNSSEHLVEAMESLLTQTYRDFALVICDDRSTDKSADVVESYWALDERVTYERNARRLGLTRNWKRVFELGLELYPGAEYFAWVSDHDVWHPRWLEVLVRALDRRPDASVVFPDSAVVTADRGLEPRRPSLDTSDLGAFDKRITRLAQRTRAGHVVYGLTRVKTLRRAGVFRHVLLADRLVLTEMALWGPLVHVPEMLWYKRPTGEFSSARQRRACFPDRVPLYARLPWWSQHALVLLLELGIRGRGKPLIQRRTGLGIASRYLSANAGHAWAGRWRWYLKARIHWGRQVARSRPKGEARGRLPAAGTRARAELKALDTLVRQADW